MFRFEIKGDAEEFIQALQTGSGERIYAMDFFAYVLAWNDAENDGDEGDYPDRPNAGLYGIGPRVAEYLRGRLVEEPND